eukprot:746783-Hanusia_phi.AAC.1
MEEGGESEKETGGKEGSEKREEGVNGRREELGGRQNDVLTCLQISFSHREVSSSSCLRLLPVTVSFPRSRLPILDRTTEQRRMIVDPSPS